MRPMKKDVNGIPVFLKELFILTPFQHLLGTLFLNVFNRLTVEGGDVLKRLPGKNVLFVSNHQTYFMEGIALMTEFDHVRRPVRHWCGKAGTGNCYYIADADTARMNGRMRHVIEWGGAVTVTRTWKKSDGEPDAADVSMDQVAADQGKVVRAIHDGWVILFPQGTTTPFSKGRKGTAHIVKRANCMVVPVVVDGFSEAFHKSKLCRPRKPGTRLKIRFKDPIDLNVNESEDAILEKIMDAIEQTDRYKTAPGDR
jgi:1-acyl-sn-glycerol-3-phosphate acyltransferase